MQEFLNIAAYQFARLVELKSLRERLIARCRALDLKGTILLSPEGINLFVAGSEDAVQKILVDLRAVPGLEGLTPKESRSAHQPFNRMLVRIKKEIISFGVEEIRPQEYTSARVSPRDLKRWLDEGRPVLLLDTRNEYEIRLGTFRNAVSLGIDTFREFPGAVEQWQGVVDERPIVTFCTGGIRCEKAAPFLEKKGFRNVYQLDGGILKYFEECGGDHYEGECFVFDQRTGVDPALRETDSAQCFRCQMPLTREEQDDPRTIPGESCPHCYGRERGDSPERLAERTAALQALLSTLPGDDPAKNYRPLRIPREHDGMRLGDFLCRAFPHLSREFWRERSVRGELVDGGREPVGLEHLVRAGERYFTVSPMEVEPPVSVDIRFLYEDADLLAVAKPSPLPVHSCGRFHRNTLQAFLRSFLAPVIPRPAHRLDAATTGVQIFTLSRKMAAALQTQFSEGRVEKWYLARVAGVPEAEEFFCDAAIKAEPTCGGGREVDPEAGLPARTFFRVIGRISDGTTLLEVNPETGRTNQIRIHLQTLGLPIVGDPHYGEVRSDAGLTGSVQDPPMGLHCWKMRFLHPRTGKEMLVEAPKPAWAETFPCGV